MKATAAAWAFWLTGTAVLFVVEWFRVAAVGRPLRGVPDGIMMVAWLVIIISRPARSGQIQHLRSFQTHKARARRFRRVGD